MLNRVRSTAAILMQFSAMFTPSLSGRNFELCSVASELPHRLNPPPKKKKKKKNGIW